jgi:hypothetical protein
MQKPLAGVLKMFVKKPAEVWPHCFFVLRLWIDGLDVAVKPKRRSWLVLDHPVDSLMISMPFD